MSDEVRELEQLPRGAATKANFLRPAAASRLEIPSTVAGMVSV
jgi:hypothetical protein